MTKTTSDGPKKDEEKSEECKGTIYREGLNWTNKSNSIIGGLS